MADRIEPVLNPFEAVIEVLIGRLFLFTATSLITVFAVAAVLWVSAINSWRFNGFNITPQRYSIIVTSTAAIVSALFLGALVLLILQAKKNARNRRQ